jgi:signal transduction histidine kinase
MRRIGRGAAVFVAGIGSFVLIAWIFDLPAVMSLEPPWLTMKANSAVCSVLVSIALLLSQSTGARRSRIAHLLAVAVLVVAAATLCEHLFGWDLRIEVLVHPRSPNSGVGAAGRMSPITAVDFIFLAAALLLLDVGAPADRRPSQWLALGAGITAAIALLGYFYDVTSLYKITSYSTTALPSAVAVLALSLAMLFARPEHGFMRVIAADSPTGALTRRLLPLIVVVPVVLGWLHLAGLRAGLYDVSFGVVLVVICNVLLLGTLTCMTAGRLIRSELLQQRARLEAEEMRSRALALEAENGRVREITRLKSVSVAKMSHELRTPLNAIIGFAALMRKDSSGTLSPEYQEYMDDILTSSRHLLQLIDEALDMAKVEGGRIELRPVVVDLKAISREVADVVRTLAAAKRLRVDVSVDPHVTTAVTDPLRLKQILYNYLSNAIKFTPEGGRVSLRVTSEGPDWFRLDVKDTGIGIPSEHFDKLFLEFQRLDGGTKNQAGTGLGLALTRQIVEAQGGRVEVQSAPGNGSIFSAVLPRNGSAVCVLSPGPPSAGLVRPPAQRAL